MLNASMSGKILNPESDVDHPVNVLASWNEEDPMTIGLSFLPEGYAESIDWVFGRALYLDAIASPDEWVGEGDVTLRAVVTGQLWIQLASPEGAARIQIPSQRLSSMIEESCKIIAPASDAEFAVYSGQFDGEIGELFL